jgi:hypothetical protein
MSVKIVEDVQTLERQVRLFIEKHARVFGIDPHLVRALITQESRFVADAESPTGAFGYGQFTGIGARQVGNIAAMADCPSPEGLDGFRKRDAESPDLGIKAICATLWWLFNKKYKNVSNKKVQLEAVLTFYNSGGKAAYLVVKHEGHDKALTAIKELPTKYQSQSLKYAPEVAQWYVAWHGLLNIPKRPHEDPVDPFDSHIGLDACYLALIESLRALDKKDDAIDVMVDSREGFTEVTLIFPGEYRTDVCC